LLLTYLLTYLLTHTNALAALPSPRSSQCRLRLLGGSVAGASL